MPELTVADVELFTKGRLLASQVETYRVLQRAYADVRTYCGWHVSPQKTETIVLDGPGDVLLPVPTRKLITLTTVVEDGVTLVNSDLTASATGRLLTKKSGMPWSSKYQAISVTLTHGYDSAPDFELAVLQAVDTTTLKVGTGGSGALRTYKVDDVERQWQTQLSSMLNKSGLDELLLEQYRLIPQI